MILKIFLPLWRHLMARKKINSGKKIAKDHLRVQLIATKFNEEEARFAKNEAQKILSLMFASLHKRGRPKKVKEEIPYAI